MFEIFKKKKEEEIIDKLLGNQANQKDSKWHLMRQKN